MRPAATKIAAHPFPHLVPADRNRASQVGRALTGDAPPDFVRHCHRRADLTGCAISALKTVMFDESMLQGMKCPVLPEALDRGDGMAFMLDRQRQARQDAVPIGQDR